MAGSKSISQLEASPTDPGSSDSTLTTQTQDVPKQDNKLKSAHKKVDTRLVLWYSLVYLVMRIHVSNISNTAIINLEHPGHGIREQLGGLTSGQWAWVLSVFYYPYMLLEPLATLALKRFTPRVWMARIMITWVCMYMGSGVVGPRVGDEDEIGGHCSEANRSGKGIISMCQGATTNFAGMMVCRFFLGAAEAGFYPGVL